MKNLPIFNATGNQLSETRSNGNTFYYSISEDGVECRQVGGIGETIPFDAMDIADDVVLLVSDILTSFQSYYNDENEGVEGFEPVSLSVSKDDENAKINRGFSHLQDEVVKKMREIYSAPQNYNTDIIIEKDGTVRTHNYFGSIDYRDNDIVWIKTITPQDIDSYLSMLQEGLTEAQLNYCTENRYITIWQTSSENEADWEEFTTDDDDSFIDDFAEMVELYNEHQEHHNRYN